MIPEVIIYCLELNLILAVFFLFYIFILKKETHFQLNRIYILSSVILAFVIPLLQISLPDQKLYTTKPFQSFISFLQEYKSIYSSGNFQFKSSEKTDKTIEKKHTDINKSLFSIKSIFHSAQLPVLLFYCSISILLLCTFLYRIIRIVVLIVQNSRIKKKGITYVYVNKLISPFSFFTFIFLPQDIHSYENCAMILTHEKIHIRQFHSIDILLIEGVSILFWFNPIIWIYKRFLRDLHEYLADSSVLQFGYNKNEYQIQLLKQGLINSGLIGCNFVRNNLNKRVTMITKNKSSYHSKFKILLVIPIVTVLICMFSISYSKVTSQKKPTILNELKLSLTVSDSTVELCAIGGCLPSITYTKLHDDYCVTDENKNIKYGFFSENDKALHNKERKIVTKVAVGDTVYEEYYYNEKSKKDYQNKNSFLNKNPIVVTKDFTCSRKPFSIYNVLDNMLKQICQKFGNADDSTSITLNIDGSVSIELTKKIKGIVHKNGFRKIMIQ